MAAPVTVSDFALFNSSLETGVRAVVVLNAAHPRAFDVVEVAWFDHLVVHTADIGGPPSLHPELPQRSGELLVRRRLVEESLKAMRRLHLVDFVPDDEAGLLYCASDEAYALVELMRSPYSLALRQRAEWLARNVCSRSRTDLEQLISERIGRWRIEFQGPESPGGLI